VRYRLSLLLFSLGRDGNRISAGAILKYLTEVRGPLKSDATGVYNTKAPYGGCGGEKVKITIFYFVKTLQHAVTL